MPGPEAAVVVVSLLAPALLLWAALRARAEQRALQALTKRPLAEPLLVVIPARNEEQRLPATLRALLRDPSPHLRVVVVDDRSSDGTAAVVRGAEFMGADPRLSLLSLDDDPPPGVFGKPRALHRAIANDAAGLVCVLDADVVVEDGFVGGFVGAFRDNGVAAASALPRLDNQSFVEELLVPAFVAAVGAVFPPSRINTGETAFLNGQMLLLDKRALDDVGGFAAVEGTVLEDVALARLLRAKHHKLLLADARALASTRMYAGFRDIVQGFGKNARALYGGRLVPLALLLLTTSWLPWMAVGAALCTSGNGDDGVAVGAAVVSVVVMMSNRARLGSRWWMGLLSPFSQLVVATVLVKAAVVRRGSWRGRSFTT